MFFQALLYLSLCLYEAYLSSFCFLQIQAWQVGGERVHFVVIQVELLNVKHNSISSLSLYRRVISILRGKWTFKNYLLCISNS